MAKLTELIARNLEFSGYGPACGYADNIVKLQWNSDLLSFKIVKGGSVKGLQDYALGGHDLPPDVHPTLAILHSLPLETPPLENIILAKFGSQVFVKTRFCWLHDPVKNMQLILHTLFYGNVPVWTEPEWVPYAHPTYNTLHKSIYQLLRKVKVEGKLPAAGDLLDDVIEWAYAKSGLGRMGA